MMLLSSHVFCQWPGYKTARFTGFPLLILGGKPAKVRSAVVSEIGYTKTLATV